MDIINFKSPAKRSPFASEFWHVIAEKNTGSVDIDYNALSKFILDKEIEIKNLPIPENKLVDGQTMLGKNSLTARFRFFNVFNWDNPEVNKLKLAIYNEYLALLNYLDLPRRRAWIQCWANVLRDGEEIALHSHGIEEYTYLSGHVTIQCNNTNTVYINPHTWGANTEEIIKPNIPGNVTFFTSHIPHYTTKHIGEKERISIAFDIILDEGTHYIHALDNLVLFDAPYRNT